MIPITIPLSFLHEIYTGTAPPVIANVPYQSRHPDFADECYRIRWELGALIARSDPEEQYFHVELFPSLDEVQIGRPASHAELYTSQTWQSSSAKRWKLKQPSVNASAPTSNARAVAYSQSVQSLVERGLMKPSAAAGAMEALIMTHLTVAPNGETLDHTSIAKSLGLSHIFAELTNAITNGTHN